MALEKLGAHLDTSRYLKREVNRYVSTPEQLLALRLCRELNDEAHKTLYLHLCKHTRPELIEAALRFVSDANAHSKGKLFSWKIKQLRAQWRKEGKNPNRNLSVAVPTAAGSSEQLSLF